jgi:6-phosphogluconolactonase
MHAYVGSFTTSSRRGRGAGVSVYRTTSEAGEWNLIQQLTDLINPSFLATSRDGTLLYAAHGDETYASAFKIDRDTGRLTILNQCETGGRNGVKIILDASERFAIIANYASGSVSVLAISPDGSLGSQVAVLQLPGEPHFRGRARQQDMSHPHDVTFDPSGRFLLVPDKGLDCIFVLEFDARDGSLKLMPQDRHTARAGSGPRHALFHPREPWVWVVNELDSTVSTYHWSGSDAKLILAHVISTIPDDFVEDSIASELVFEPTSNTLYVSNRGHGSLAMFRPEPASGALRNIGWISSGGPKPRFFCLGPSSDVLCVAEEQDCCLVMFKIDSLSGRLQRLGGLIEIASPVSVVFVPSSTGG